ncbi:MAG: tRNA (N6-threonylcarbamoyladenosine(37)-N6)-methyltransferase TrmO [bacterium]
MEDHEKDVKEVSFQPIGVIHSPYRAGGFAPFQPLERDEGRSSIELFAGYEDALDKLETFQYIYVLFYMHSSKGEWKSEVSPPWAKGKKVGLFASRSPRRPNPVGLSIVQLKKIEGNTLHTSVIDAYDGTPVLDLKPYIRGLDSKDDANVGWVEEMEGGYEHILQHVRGIPHQHEEGEGHHHKHQHEHGHHHGEHHHGDEDGHEE